MARSICSVVCAGIMVSAAGQPVAAQVPDHPIITEVHTDPPGANDGPVGRDPGNLHQEFLEIYLPTVSELSPTLNKDSLEITFYEVEGDSASSGVKLVNYRFDLPPFDVDASNGITPGAIARPANGVIVLGWVDYVGNPPTGLAGTPGTRLALINGGITSAPSGAAFIAINGHHFGGTNNFPVLQAESLIDLPGETSSGTVQNGSAAYLLVDRSSLGYVELYDDKHIPIGGSADPSLPSGTVLQTSALFDALAANDHSKFDVVEQPYLTPTGDDIDLETSLPLGGAFSLLVPQIDEDDLSPTPGIGNGYARIYLNVPKTTENVSALDDDPVADAMNAYRVIRNTGPFFPSPGMVVGTTSPPELSVALESEQLFQILTKTTGRPGVLSANVGGNFGIDLTTAAGPSSAPNTATFGTGTSATAVPGQSLGFPSVAITAAAPAQHGQSATSAVTVTASNTVGGDPAVLSTPQVVTVTATVIDPTTGLNAAGQPFQTTVFAVVQPLVSDPLVANELLATDLGAFVAANLNGLAQDTQGLGAVLVNPATNLSDPLVVRPMVKEFPDAFIEYINPAGPPGKLDLVQTVLTSAEVVSGADTYDQSFTPTFSAVRAIRFNVPDTLTFGGTFSPSELVQFADGKGLLGAVRSGLSNATTSRSFEVVLVDTNVRLAGTIENGATDDLGLVVEVELTEPGSPVVDGEFVFLSFTGGKQGADLDGFDIVPGTEVVANLVYLDLDNLHDVLGIRSIEALWLIDSGNDSESDFIEAFSLNPALLLFDSDADGDVDLVDLASFVGCLSGPVDPALAPCSVHDADANGRVDLRDFGGLQNVFTGLP